MILFKARGSDQSFLRTMTQPRGRVAANYFPTEKVVVLLVCVVTLISTQGVWAGGVAPSAPTDLAGIVDGNLVTLDWTPSADDDEVQGYNIYQNNQYLTTVATNRYTGTITTDVLSRFHVVAYDSPPTRYSAPSATIELPQNLIPDDTTIPPSVPTDLAGLILGDEVSFNWSASTDDETVLGYNIYQNNQYLTTVYGTEYNGAVSAGENYSYYVVAFDIRYNFSDRSEKLRLPDTGFVDVTPPTVPVNVTGFVSGADTVTVTWDRSSDDQGVAGYNVYQNNQYVTTTGDAIYTGTIEAGTFNVFSVVAFDNDSNFSTQSEGLTLPEPDGSIDLDEPPTSPLNLVGEYDDQNNQASLGWTASSDNVGVLGYNVYRNNDYVTTVSGTAWSETVEQGSYNTYYAVAFDIHGNFSVRSESITIPERTGPDLPPSKPLNLTGSTDTLGATVQIGLSWSASSDDQQVSGYNVYQNNTYETTVGEPNYSTVIDAGQASSWYVVAFDVGGNFFGLIGSTNSDRWRKPSSSVYQFV